MTTATTERRSTGARDEDGFTIVEMAVTIMILGIVLAVLFNFLNSTMLLSRRAERDLQSEQSMTIALRAVTEDIRAASSLNSCGAGYSLKWCVSFDVPRTTTSPALACPQRTITYNMSGGTVYETELDYPSASCSPTTTKFSNKPLLQNLSNGATDYFLTWYDKTGLAFDPDASPGTVSSTGSIKALVKLNYGVPGSPTISLNSIAALRNFR